MEASKWQIHNTSRSSQRIVRTRKQAHHIAQCLCSWGLGGWLAGKKQKKSSALRAKKGNIAYFKYLILFCLPKWCSSSTRSSIRTIIAYSLPVSLPLFPAAAGNISDSPAEELRHFNKQNKIRYLK
jgi:hypothetical protein